MSKKLRKDKSRRYVVLSLPRVSRPVRNISLISVLVLGSNILTHQLWDRTAEQIYSPKPVFESASTSGELYLLEKARKHIPQLEAFEEKVREVSTMLSIPPEWLMAVIYAESAFDPGVANYQGSGAVGLIQFMPATADALDVSIERLQRMDSIQQMEYVYRYLQQVRERYGEFESLTDLYLSILYPKARKQDYCYRLYANPSIAYQRNTILDENKDGQVTVTDIDKRMKRLFPTAYHTAKSQS